MMVPRGLLASLPWMLLLPVSQASPLIQRRDTATITPTAAAPSTTIVYDWAAGGTPQFPIHHSCNSTLRNQLQQALDELVVLAEHARDHILRWGGESPFVQKYFGKNSSTAEPIGWYDRIIAADKNGMTFRCDDPDLNCATQEGYGGHWRGSNATQETVICALSFETRRYLSSMCNLGYTVAASPLNTFWATDLLHRVLHVPKIAEMVVEHVAEEYTDVLELGEGDPAQSARDIHALQYFAVDVYAYDVAAPGIGCMGEPAKEEEEVPTTTTTAQPSATSVAAKECHTHDNGDVHCE
ncbi:Major allergen Asp f 2-like protein [Pleurostoma richardsiae]|uniref:Major allergen Asp f 2-like protein n=1 Tax=Pleurostoma richardsiae TaxID=41990 RepID=A0AA38VHD6_9PEZI|nr:Major allergen Asp f 2-like protein [Pleurostoma richardsiae]